MAGRRLWRAFDMLAPSLKLSPDYGNLKSERPYPFSVKPDKAVSVEDVMAILGDSLEVKRPTIEAKETYYRGKRHLL